MESIIVVVTRVMNMKEAEVQGLSERRSALGGVMSAGKEEKQGFFSRFKGKKKGK